MPDETRWLDTDERVRRAVVDAVRILREPPPRDPMLVDEVLRALPDIPDGRAGRNGVLSDPETRAAIDASAALLPVAARGARGYLHRLTEVVALLVQVGPKASWGLGGLMTDAERALGHTLLPGQQAVHSNWAKWNDPQFNGPLPSRAGMPASTREFRQAVTVTVSERRDHTPRDRQLPIFEAMFVVLHREGWRDSTLLAYRFACQLLDVDALEEFHAAVADFAKFAAGPTAARGARFFGRDLVYRLVELDEWMERFPKNTWDKATADFAAHRIMIDLLRQARWREAAELGDELLATWRMQDDLALHKRLVRAHRKLGSTAPPTPAVATSVPPALTRLIGSDDDGIAALLGSTQRADANAVLRRWRAPLPWTRLAGLAEEGKLSDGVVAALSSRPDVDPAWEGMASDIAARPLARLDVAPRGTGLVRDDPRRAEETLSPVELGLAVRANIRSMLESPDVEWILEQLRAGRFGAEEFIPYLPYAAAAGLAAAAGWPADPSARLPDFPVWVEEHFDEAFRNSFDRAADRKWAWAILRETAPTWQASLAALLSEVEGELLARQYLRFDV